MTFDSRDILRIRAGAVRGLSINADRAGWADTLAITSVESITVESAAGVSVGNIVITDGHTITANFDASAGVDRPTPYEVCVHLTLDSQYPDVLRLPLRVMPGC